MKPLISTRLNRSGRRLGPGVVSVALYSEMSPQRGMRAFWFRSVITARSTSPPTFSK